MLRRLAYLRAEMAEVQGAYDEAESELTRRVEERERAAKEKESPVDKSSDEKKEASKIDPGVQVIFVDERDRGSDDDSEKTEEEEEDVPQKEVDPSPTNEHYKKLWRVIAKETHPDVAGDDPELTSLYKTASKAYKDNDYPSLLDVAADLGIRLGEPEPELVVDAATRCDFYVKKLESLKGSTVWLWGSASPEAKDAALEILIKNREARAKSKSKSQ